MSQTRHKTAPEKRVKINTKYIVYTPSIYIYITWYIRFPFGVVYIYTYMYYVVCTILPRSGFMRAQQCRGLGQENNTLFDAMRKSLIVERMS